MKYLLLIAFMLNGASGLTEPHARYFLDEYDYDSYPGFVPQSGNPGCGVTAVGDNLLSLGEGCTARVYPGRLQRTIDARRTTRYWITFTPVEKNRERAISRTHRYKFRPNKSFETIRFRMQGTGTYRMYFDENNNSYPESSASFFIFEK